MTKITGGQLVVQVLEEVGTKEVFCVPGESYLSVLDALYDHLSIQLISNRHEGGASFMTEAYAKSSGKVGVCMATRGPGASNLSIGLHTAQQDSTPVVALIGQVERSYRKKEAFQEVNLEALFGHLCKWTVEINDAKRVPELVHRAFRVAQTGRPGPVVVSLPQDMLEETVDLDDTIQQRQNTDDSETLYPSEKSINKAVEEIQNAKRPVIIAGGGIIKSGATPILSELAQKLEIPVVTAFRRYDAFPNSHPCYAGWLGIGPNPKLVKYIASADLVIALGTRFSQMTTQDYHLLQPNTHLIHVDISHEIIGKVYSPTLPIVADVRAFLDQLVKKIESVDIQKHGDLTNRLHQEFLNFSSAPQDYHNNWVDMDGLMYDFIQSVPTDTIITSDAGNFFGWLARYYRFEKPGTYIGPTSGAMGYGLPAAIGAKLAHPDRPVISFSGDGGFMMTLQELETSLRYNSPVVAIVVNNNLYGTIRAHQEKHFPDRVVGTPLSNPSFAELVKLFGGHGEQVKNNKEFLPALERAMESGRTSVVEVFTNPEILSVSQSKDRSEVKTQAQPII